MAKVPIVQTSGSVKHLDTAVTTVANQTARLALTNQLVGQRVKQTDLPSVVWTYEGGGESNNANWSPYVITDSSGDIIADLILPETTGLTPSANVLGRYGRNLVLGDGTSLNGKLINSPNIAGKGVEFEFRKVGLLANVSVQAGTVGGVNYYVRWWDGTIASTTNLATLNKAWTADYEHLHKTIQVYGANGAAINVITLSNAFPDKVIFGRNNTSLTYVEFQGEIAQGGTDMIDVTPFASTLTELHCPGIVSQSDIFGLERCTALTEFTTNVTTLDLTELTDAFDGLAALYIYDGTTTIVPAAVPTLTYLSLGSNTTLTALNCSGFTGLTTIDGPQNTVFWSNATACNNFFTSLPDRTSLSAGDILYNTNEPAGTTSIATAKNWTLTNEA